VTGEQIEASLLSHSYEAMCVHRFIPRKNKEIKEIFWNPKNKIVSIVWFNSHFSTPQAAEIGFNH